MLTSFSTWSPDGGDPRRELVRSPSRRAPKVRTPLVGARRVWREPCFPITALLRVEGRQGVSGGSQLGGLARELGIVSHSPPSISRIEESVPIPVRSLPRCQGPS